MVYVQVDLQLWRPMIVSHTEVVALHERATPTGVEASAVSFRLSGTIFAQPDDHTRPAFRSWARGGLDPARIHGRPDRYLTAIYGECLARGRAVGDWLTRRELEGH